MNVTEFFLNLVMAALTDHTASGSFNGPLESVYMGLYIAPTGGLSKSSTIANITEATYAGYARQAVTWYPPVVDAAGPETLNGQSLNFTPTGSTTPNTITGLFLADALTAGDLLAYMALPGIGVALSGPTQSLVAIPQFQLPFTPIYGMPTIIQ